MSTQQVMNTPINPIVALASLPQPQVIEGTLGEQGNPLPYQDVRDFPSIMDSNLIENVDFIDSFSVNTSFPHGTSLFTCQTPIMKADSTGNDYNIAHVMNWSHFPMLTHLYWDVVQQIGFTMVAPQAITGKLLITYDPTALNSYGFDKYRVDRRKITTEWDLSESKTKWIEVEGFKLDEKRSITHYNIPASSSSGYDFAQQQLHDFSCNLGMISLNIIQPLQAVALYPSSFTVLVFASNSKTKFYTPTDPRRFDVNFVSPYRNYRFKSN